MTAALADMAINEDLDAAERGPCRLRLGDMEGRKKWRRKLHNAFYYQQAIRAATAPHARPPLASARGTAAEVTPRGEGDGRSKSNARRK